MIQRFGFYSKAPHDQFFCLYIGVTTTAIPENGAYCKTLPVRGAELRMSWKNTIQRITGVVNAVKPRNGAWLCHYFPSEAHKIVRCRDRGQSTDEQRMSRIVRSGPASFLLTILVMWPGSPQALLPPFRTCSKSLRRKVRVGMTTTNESPVELKKCCQKRFQHFVVGRPQT